MALEQLKRELERFGEQNDGAQHSRGSKMLNITRDTGELLAVLVQTRGAQAVLEIGTSNGYSTLWLAEAGGPGHHHRAGRGQTDHGGDQL